MKRKILVIDDEEKICSLVSAFLGEKGFSVVTAKNGKEGIKVAQRVVPDLILLDINMPELDGYAVLERLKNDGKTMSIPTIMLTGRDDEESKIKASGLYSEDYITKPFELEQLFSKVVRVLEFWGVKVS